MKMGRLNEALADYAAEIHVGPGNAYPLFGRGVAKHRKGGLPGSNADMASAKAIKEDVAEAMAKLGVRP
jgi:hypothetical protein